MDKTSSMLLIPIIFLIIAFLPCAIAEIRKNRNSSAIFTLSFLSVLPLIFVLFPIINNDGNISNQLVAILFAPAISGFSYIG